MTAVKMFQMRVIKPAQEERGACAAPAPLRPARKVIQIAALPLASRAGWAQKRAQREPTRQPSATWLQRRLRALRAA